MGAELLIAALGNIFIWGLFEWGGVKASCFEYAGQSAQKRLERDN